MQVFSRAWGRAMTIPNAQAAFRTTGVYPFDQSAVKIDETFPNITEFLTKATGQLHSPLEFCSSKAQNFNIKNKINRDCTSYCQL